MVSAEIPAPIRMSSLMMISPPEACEASLAATLTVSPRIETSQNTLDISQQNRRRKRNYMVQPQNDHSHLLRYCIDARDFDERAELNFI
jgi:hypothetical protein